MMLLMSKHLSWWHTNSLTRQPKSKSHHHNKSRVSRQPRIPRVSPPAHVPVSLKVFHKGHAFPGVGFADVEHVGVGVWPGFGGVVLPGGSGGVVEPVGPGGGVGSGEDVDGVLGGFEPFGEEGPGSDHFY